MHCIYEQLLRVKRGAGADSDEHPALNLWSTDGCAVPCPNQRRPPTTMTARSIITKIPHTIILYSVNKLILNYAQDLVI